MNRFNYSYSSDASMMAAHQTAAIARGVAGSFVIGCIVVIAALSGCQRPPASGSRVLDTSAVESIAPQATDASLDTQLRLDPGEILLYTQNVHG